MAALVSTLSTTLRRAFPVLVGIGLFAAGLFALYHLLEEVDAVEVMVHIRSLPPLYLLSAVLATAVAYAALVGYDVLALRFIGRKLPGRVVALGGFLAYAFGNTIGVSVVSGGAVRYRIYSAVGLNAFEVATVSAYIAVALGTGLTLIGLTALAVHPGVVASVLPLSEGMVRWGSAATVAISVAVIIAVSWGNLSLRLWKLELRLPSISNLAGQLVVTVVDVVAAAFTLWVLMPAGTPDFTSFVAIYSIAMMVGVLSHVPGGVGVFETVVISTLPAGVPVSEAAAALLMFRVIYYLLPFAVGFLMVSLNELRLAGGAIGRLVGRVPGAVGEPSGAMRPALDAVHGMAPSLAALATFGFGVYLLLVSLVPAVRSEALEERDIVSTLLLETGALGSAMLGVVLLILSHGLIRRIKAAYVLSLLALATGSVTSLLNGLDLKSAAVLATGALLLLSFGRGFYRKAPLTDSLFSPSWFVLVFGVVTAAAVFFFFVHRDPMVDADVWLRLVDGPEVPRAFRAVMVASALLLVISLYAALRPLRIQPVSSSEPGALDRAEAIVGAAGQPRGCLALTGDKQFLFSEQGGAFLMFAEQGKTWIALGDPVGAPEEQVELCWNFVDLARRAGYQPVFYEVGPGLLQRYAEMGFSLHLVGEEAIVMLPGYVARGDGPDAPNLRLDAWQERGHEVEIVRPPHSPMLLDRLKVVSAAWLAGRMGRDKGFTVGRFEPEWLQRFPLALVRRDAAIVGFAVILAPGAGRAVAIDLLRYLPEEADGMLEGILLSVILRYRDLGAESFSLGVTPLAGLEARSVERLWTRFGSFVYRHGAAFRNFDELRAFRKAFRPGWEPRYIAVPPGLTPTRAMTSVALRIAGGSRRLLGRDDQQPKKAS